MVDARRVFVPVQGNRHLSQHYGPFPDRRLIVNQELFDNCTAAGITPDVD